jgi:hypothetical protein
MKKKRTRALKTKTNMKVSFNYIELTYEKNIYILKKKNALGVKGKPVGPEAEKLFFDVRQSYCTGFLKYIILRSGNC